MSRPDAHIDIDDLALLALGEPVADAGHVAQCARCQAELDQISATVVTARSVTTADRPLAPGPEVWERIRRDVTPTPPPRTRSRRAGATQRRWSWTMSPALLAGAAAAVVGVAVVAVPEQAPPTVLAAASLAALDDRGVAGTADVVTDGTTRTLAVEVGNLKPQDGAFYEVWLIAPDVSKMVSLGVVDGAGSSLPIPAGLDLAGYPIVDISLEPMDGDPVHSKVSLSRGELSV